MKTSHFPDPRCADESGLVCYGGTLATEILVDAYSHGIFPWPHEGYPLLWFSPRKRGVLDFSELHIPRRLERTIKGFELTWTWNSQFSEVMDHCSKVPRKGQAGTWITDEMYAAYCELNRLGYAHSLECWDSGQLVGGLYGVDVCGVFSGESMFGLKRDISKIVLIHCVRELQKFGHSWMDTQMVSSVVGQLGGKEIPNEEFFVRLARERKSGKRFSPPRRKD